MQRIINADGRRMDLADGYYDETGVLSILQLKVMDHMVAP